MRDLRLLVPQAEPVTGVHRRLAQHAASLLQVLRSARQVDAESLLGLLTECEHRRDERVEAFAHYIAGASGVLDPTPRACLKHLRIAERYFHKHSMLAMERQVRFEAAWQLRLAGFYQLGLDTLAPRKLGANEFDSALSHAVCAACLLDLGRVDEALASANRALTLCAATRGEVDARVRQRASAIFVQVQITCLLADRGIDCHLTEMPMVVNSWRLAQVAASGTDWTALTELDRLDASSLEPAASETQALVAMANVVHTPESPGRRAALLHLASRLAARPDGCTAQAWLWLGLAYSVVANNRAASLSLQQAVDLADRQGQTRVKRLALYDLAIVLERDGQVNQALEALKALKRLESQLRSSAPPEQESSELANPTPVPADLQLYRSPHLRTAMRLLRGERRSFTVDSLAAECGVSRRTLEKVFRHELRQSVAECIRSRRLSLAREKLVFTGDSIKKIAIEVGYPSASALCHDFKRATGMTPAGFRGQSRND